MAAITLEELREKCNSAKIQEKEIDVEGVGTVRIRALNGLEMADFNDLKSSRERNVFILRHGLIDPALKESDALMLLEKLPVSTLNIIKNISALSDARKEAESDSGKQETAV